MRSNPNKIILNIIYAISILLIAFLPFSSYAVSLTGKPSVSLVRDILIILLILFSIPFFQKNKHGNHKYLLALVIGFVCYSALTFFWKESSTLQWLRGFRFLIFPYFLLVIFRAIPRISFKAEKLLLNTIIFVGIIISIAAIAECFGIKIFPVGQTVGTYSLSQIHSVQGTNFQRLQSILAGPNAFGLYLLALIGCLIGYRAINFKNKFLISLLLLFFMISLLLTFSRSAFAGLFVLLLTALFQYARQRFGAKKALAWSASAILFTLIIGIFIFQKESNILTHGDSTELRFVQYERIWDTKSEIGLLGRGVGTAGPSSQYRLDGGENHWTENIYLDIFEELGLVGLLLYLAVLFLLLYISSKNYSSSEGETAFLITVGFAVSGLFINIYTGQVGIYLMFLANGLMLNNLPKESYGANID